MIAKTFLATGILQYRDPSDTETNEQSASISNPTLQRWLQVTLPLTWISFLVWWLVYIWSRKAAARKHRATLLPVHGEPSMSWHEKKSL